MEAKAKLINEILQVCKAGDCYVSGDLFLGLAFRTEKELKDMAHELHIKL